VTTQMAYGKGRKGKKKRTEIRKNRKQWVKNKVTNKKGKEKQIKKKKKNKMRNGGGRMGESMWGKQKRVIIQEDD